MCPHTRISFFSASSLQLSPLVQSVSYLCKFLSILHIMSFSISVALESLYFWDCALFPFLEHLINSLLGFVLAFPSSWPNCFSPWFRWECACGVGVGGGRRGEVASLGFVLSPFLSFIWNFLYLEFCYVKCFTLFLQFLAYARKSFKCFPSSNVSIFISYFSLVFS